MADRQTSNAPEMRIKTSTVVETNPTSPSTLCSAPSPSTSNKNETSILSTPATTGTEVDNIYEQKQANVGPFHEYEGQPYLPRQWKVTWFRFGPLSGIFAMLVALASIVMATAVLVSSDGQSVDKWGSAEPAILLAISTAIANLSIRFACVQGVVNLWWVRALKGSSLAKLHHDWRSGTTLRGAVTAGRHVGVLGLAMIFSTISVISGPLLQRSSSVTSAPIGNEPQMFAVSMSPEVPSRWGGMWASKRDLGFTVYPFIAFNETVPSGDGTSVSNGIYCSEVERDIDVGSLYFSDASIPGVISGCPGRCRAVIRAPALKKTACTTKEVIVEYEKNPVKLSPDLSVASPLNQLLFFIGASLIVDDPSGMEKVNLITGHSSTERCNGTLEYTACTLESAIGEYDVLIENNMLLLHAVAPPQIVALANNTAVDHTMDPAIYTHNSTLASVVSAFLSNWGTFVAAYKSQDEVSFASSNEVAYTQYQRPASGGCNPFHDPFADMFMSLNKAMFISGAVAARESRTFLESRLDPGLVDQVHHNVTGYVVGEQAVWKSDYWWFLAAVLVEVICIAFIAPTYWGWWTLGRPVSFSPLEIAKAFDAPLLARFDTNATSRDLSKALWSDAVRYGRTDDGQGRTKLQFAPEEAVRIPEDGGRYP